MQNAASSSEQHYFLKNMPIVSANGYAVDVWQCQSVNQEMLHNSLFKKSTDWIREKVLKPDCLLKSIEAQDLRGVMDAVDAGISVNYKDIKGRTALHLSVNFETHIGLQITSFLLLRNANVFVKDRTRYMRTPLLQAVKSRNIEAVKLLLGEQADIDETDAIGRTALIYACEHDLEDIAQILISHGADIHKRDLHGNTAALVARPRLSHILSATDESFATDNEFWDLFGTWGGRDYEDEMF